MSILKSITSLLVAKYQAFPSTVYLPKFFRPNSSPPPLEKSANMGNRRRKQAKFNKEARKAQEQHFNDGVEQEEALSQLTDISLEQFQSYMSDLDSSNEIGSGDESGQREQWPETKAGLKRKRQALEKEADEVFKESLKDFAFGLRDLTFEPIFAESAFGDKDRIFKAIEENKKMTDSGFALHCQRWTDHPTNMRMAVDDSGVDDTTIRPHVRVLLTSTNRKTPCRHCNTAVAGCPECVEDHVRQLPYIPTLRSPTFIGQLTNLMELEDRELAYDVANGFPMNSNKPTGNWVLRQPTADQERGGDQKRQLRGERARVRYPLDSNFTTPADQLRMFENMESTVRSDAARGRHELVEEEAYRKAMQERGRNLVKLFPIDQSYTDILGKLFPTLSIFFLTL
jgi:hypothetical protein